MSKTQMSLRKFYSVKILIPEEINHLTKGCKFVAFLEHCTLDFIFKYCDNVDPKSFLVI